ncbi:hypothetical protein APY04_3103 [Hyphomicrobium sulfonivorans]|uniref:Uncharacterized protein n=1 Tax=Hyphomicrobium sulfonivorans TaxID=121290 RepID=A0A109B9U6_HYPSL|nr:hypothetical protein APY04_3103 [Hyphomicrobium sulfonivorans]
MLKPNASHYRRWTADCCPNYGSIGYSPARGIDIVRGVHPLGLAAMVYS